MPGNNGTQDVAQIITMGSVTNSSPSTGQVWWDGTNLKMNIGGTIFTLTHPQPATSWSVSGLVATHVFNAAASTTTTNAQAIATLINDLQTIGIIT